MASALRSKIDTIKFLSPILHMVFDQRILYGKEGRQKCSHFIREGGDKNAPILTPNQSHGNTEFDMRVDVYQNCSEKLVLS